MNKVEELTLAMAEMNAKYAEEKLAFLKLIKELAEYNPKWIPVTERLPGEFVSVLGYMTDAGEFPPVRECYLVGRAFFFPALRDCHPVSHWMEMPQPPVCEIKEYVESCEECGFCEKDGAAHEN